MKYVIDDLKAKISWVSKICCGASESETHLGKLQQTKLYLPATCGTTMPRDTALQY